MWRSPAGEGQQLQLLLIVGREEATRGHRNQAIAKPDGELRRRGKLLPDRTGFVRAVISIARRRASPSSSGLPSHS